MTPRAELAVDEALLLAAEEGGPPAIRCWEIPSSVVVLGAGCKVADEVDVAACQADVVPILRRASGGGTVLLGRGCLLYSLVLPYGRDPALAHVVSSYAFILNRLAQTLTHKAPGIALAGTSDLACGGRKVSGNSQQRKRRSLLHHGTLLYDFDLAAMPRYLKMPERQPEYRQRREHVDFLANLPATRQDLEAALHSAWPDLPILDESDVPEAIRARAEELARDKYGRDEWTFRR